MPCALACRISDKGALQLTIDCDALLRALLELPRAAVAAKKAHSARDSYADIGGKLLQGTSCYYLARGPAALCAQGARWQL